MTKALETRPNAVAFGQIIRRLRLERGWTIAELARQSEMHPNYLATMEKGGNTRSHSSTTPGSTRDSRLGGSEAGTAGSADCPRLLQEIRLNVVSAAQAPRAEIPSPALIGSYE